MRGVFILLTVALLFIVPLGAQQEQFDKANNAYNDGDFKLSIELYEGILTGGEESADLYLNLGNAYLKSGALGEAILHYEKGLKIDDTHQVLAQNLKYANKQITTPITAIPDFFLSRYWKGLTSSFGSTGWAAVQILLFIIIAITVGVWLLGKQLKHKKLAFYSLIFSTVLLLISFLAGTQAYNAEQNASHAVVLSESAKLLTGASSQSELILNISEGTKVRLIDRIDDYYKIQLLDKEIGWISINEIEAI